MVSVDEAVIARISKHGMHFEILVDPDVALELKRGKDVNIEDLLAVTDVFKDANKGERHSEEDLQKAFGTKDIFEIAKFIVTNGEVQLTTEQRYRFAEERKKEIATIISKQAIDPKTKLPHPVQRILNAMKEAHVSVDPFKPAKEQVKPVLEKIQEILPISLERMEIAIKIPMEYAGRVNPVVRNLATIKQEEWRSDGWIAVVEIPAGLQTDLYDKLNSLTHGKVEVKILKEFKI